ncbi:response regulator [Aquipuribacter sp. MA13-6]|uniref:response regulator n=1 Tax=unclassified Aquipuribacter TaxID=2635084 RepID=UPI003EEE4621
MTAPDRAAAEEQAGTGTTGVTVLVADDHPVVRAGIVALLGLEPDLEVVGEAADGHEAVRLHQELDPDVLLTDLRMPGLDGTDATEAILRRDPGAAVLVLTTYDSDADILRAVEAGARGYLLKDSGQEVLVAGVRAAARGETVLAPAVAARLLHRVRAPAAPHLTARETEVLRGVAEGWSNAEIGRRLYIGEATVKTHLLRVFAKLDVDDRTRAVVVASRHGLL